MECEERDRLEQTMMAIRERGTQLAIAGKMTEELTRDHAAHEAEAIQALTDYTAEHGCRELGD
jgi:hypothetical protein